jgi:FkbM family methyltransferase
MMPLCRWQDTDFKCSLVFPRHTLTEEGWCCTGTIESSNRSVIFQRCLEYFSILYSHIVGPQGGVMVFEPGGNNLEYIRKNIAQCGTGSFSPIELSEAAVGENDGEKTFYEENLTGQNNSLVKDFSGLQANEIKAHARADINERSVKVKSIDSIDFSTKPDFIKIDVEGYEWGVLLGATQTIKKFFPAMMIEVQANKEEIFDFLTNHGYRMFDDHKRELKYLSQLRMNVFCMHATVHNELISRVFLK